MEPFNKIANFLSGAASEQEKQEIASWRGASSANEAEFRKFEKIWNNGIPSSSFNPDADLAWKKVSDSLFKGDEISVEKKKSARFVTFPQSAFKIAAAISLLALSALVYFFLKPDILSNHNDELLSIVTSQHEKQAITLSDGTRVYLNQESTIRYPTQFTDSLREVYLDGEAFFEVESMPEKPFLIHVGAAKVRVLGTSFNLRSTVKQYVELQVLSGQVLFSAQENPATSLLLKAGDAASLVDEKIIPTDTDINFLSWKTGAFIFQNNSLQEVFKALEAYYPINFKADNPQLLKCRLSARFSQQTLEEVLQVLELSLNLTHSTDEDKKLIIFSYSGKGPHCAGENL